MSENPGKDGEMRFGILVAGASIRNSGLDFTRHSVTNQPDLGVDYNVQGKAETLVSFCETGVGTSLPLLSEVLGDLNRVVEGRVDVKTTQNKLTGVAVDKFASDVKKHPNTAVHVLVGGNGLTKTGQRKWDAHQAALSADGKALVYLPNEAVARLANEYQSEILSSLNGLLGIEQSSPPENDA